MCCYQEIRGPYFPNTVGVGWWLLKYLHQNNFQRFAGDNECFFIGVRLPSSGFKVSCPLSQSWKRFSWVAGGVEPKAKPVPRASVSCWRESSAASKLIKIHQSIVWVPHGKCRGAWPLPQESQECRQAGEARQHVLLPRSLTIQFHTLLVAMPFRPLVCI